MEFDSRITRGSCESFTFYSFDSVQLDGGSHINKIELFLGIVVGTTWPFCGAAREKITIYGGPLVHVIAFEPEFATSKGRLLNKQFSRIVTRPLFLIRTQALSSALLFAKPMLFGPSELTKP